MADSTQPTPEQARELAARFAVVCSHAPRMLTTVEADRIQTLGDRLRNSPEPIEVAYGFALDRLFEALMAVSAVCYQREADIRMLSAQLNRAVAPAIVEKVDQIGLLARFASVASGQEGVLERVLDAARIPEEDFHAAVSELLPTA
jgi:hypothetical protein